MSYTPKELDTTKPARLRLDSHRWMVTVLDSNGSPLFDEEVTTFYFMLAHDIVDLQLRKQGHVEFSFIRIVRCG